MFSFHSLFLLHHPQYREAVNAIDIQETHVREESLNKDARVSCFRVLTMHGLAWHKTSQTTSICTVLVLGGIRFQDDGTKRAVVDEVSRSSRHGMNTMSDSRKRNPERVLLTNAEN